MVWLRTALQNGAHRDLLEEDGSLFLVGDDDRFTTSNSLRCLSSKWMLTAFSTLQTPTAGALNVDALFNIWQVEVRGTDCDRPRTLSRIAEQRKVVIEADPKSVLELMVLRVPNLSELSAALDAGLVIPTWVVRKPSKDYQVGWIMTRSNVDMKKGTASRPAKKGAEESRWPEEDDLVNPANPDNPLIFVNMVGGHRPAAVVKRSVMKVKHEAFRANASGGSDDFAAALKEIRGRAGGSARTARKKFTSAKNVADARAEKKARAVTRGELIRKLRADHVEPSEIKAIVGCSLRTVQRHLREDG